MTTKSTKAAPAAETVDETAAAATEPATAGTAAAAAASAVTAEKVEYDPTTWADGSAGGTPITAAQLNRMETGIGSLATQNNALVDDIDALGDSLGQMVTTNVSGQIMDVGNHDVLFAVIATSKTDGHVYWLTVGKNDIALWDTTENRMVWVK